MTEGQQETARQVGWALQQAWSIDLRMFPGPRWEPLRRQVWEARGALEDVAHALAEQAALDKWIAERRSRLPGLQGDD